MKTTKTTAQAISEDNFICPTCGQEFHKTECAKELCDSGEYFCQKCWDIPE